VKQEEYWLREFGGDIPGLNLPTDFERPFIQSFEGGAVSFSLNQGITRMLKKIALEEGATIFMVFLAIYSILLSRLASQDVLVVGTSTAGRPHNDLESVVGMFVNSLALKITLEKGKTFKEFLRSVKDKTLQAFDNQDYQFDDLVKKLAPNRVRGRNPLFDVRLTMDNIEPTLSDIPELASISYEYANNVSKFDMTLFIVDSDDTLNGTIIYCSQLFKEETIIQFIDFIKEIVQQVLDKSDIKLEGIKLTHGFTIVQHDIEGIDLNF
jgi:non-ribosomal peptide synthetase component F